MSILGILGILSLVANTWGLIYAFGVKEVGLLIIGRVIAVVWSLLFCAGFLIGKCGGMKNGWWVMYYAILSGIVVGVCYYVVLVVSGPEGLGSPYAEKFTGERRSMFYTHIIIDVIAVLICDGWFACLLASNAWDKES